MNRREFLHIMGVSGGIGLTIALAGLTTKTKKIEAKKGLPLIPSPIKIDYQLRKDKVVIEVGKEFAGKVLRVYVIG